MTDPPQKRCVHCGLDYGLHVCGICGKVTCENCMWQHTHEKPTATAPTASQITTEDHKAVKRLQEHFRRRAWDLKYTAVTDHNFLRWLGDVMESIRSEEYAHVKKVLENDPAFTRRKEKSK